jgi:hypothetical protein
MLRPGVVGIWHEGRVMISCRLSDNSQAGSRVRGARAWKADIGAAFADKSCGLAFEATAEASKSARYLLRRPTLWPSRPISRTLRAMVSLAAALTLRPDLPVEVALARHCVTVSRGSPLVTVPASGPATAHRSDFDSPEGHPVTSRSSAILWTKPGGGLTIVKDYVSGRRQRSTPLMTPMASPKSTWALSGEKT